MDNDLGIGPAQEERNHLLDMIVRAEQNLRDEGEIAFTFQRHQDSLTTWLVGLSAGAIAAIIPALNVISERHLFPRWQILSVCGLFMLAIVSGVVHRLILQRFMVVDSRHAHDKIYHLIALQLTGPIPVAELLKEFMTILKDEVGRLKVLKNRAGLLQRLANRVQYVPLVAFLLGVAGLIVGLFGLLGAVEPKAAASVVAELRVQRIVLVDNGGRQQAMLQTVPSGLASLGLLDATGKLRGVFGVRPDSVPDLVLYDRDGTARVGLSLRADGSPVLRLSDAQGKGRAMLSLNADGSPVLRLRDPNEQARVSVGFGPDQTPTLMLLDAKGKVTWRVPESGKRE